MTNGKGLRIIRLSIENIKRLTAVEIVPNSDVVQITGANGSGKTSVLDAIFWVLAGKSAIQSDPIRHGEEFARIELDLGAIVVTRTFDADGTTKVTVEADTGARYTSPQTMLDNLLGSLTFDPLAFMRMDAKKQLAELRKIVKLDVDIDTLAGQNFADFENRKGVNRDIQRLSSQLEAFKGPRLVTAPVRVDVDALVDAIANAQTVNRERMNERAARQDERDHVEHKTHEAADARKEAAELLAKADHLEQWATGELRRLEALPPIAADVDVTDLRAQIEGAKAANAIADTFAAREKIRLELEERQAVADEYTANIERRNAERTAAIAAATFPVPGLAFGDAGVVFNGSPFDQSSGAEQLRVSLAVAMAANPQLRVIRITDGSLLDERSLAMVADMAATNDYQVWIEQVDTSGRVGIVMQDGAVVAVNPSTLNPSST